MDYSRKFFVTSMLGLLLSACASDPIPPDYMRIGISDDAAASVLGEYLRSLPSDWERGTITISPCEDAAIDVDCDFYVEHHTRQCDFGAYMLYFSGDAQNLPHYKTIRDERAKDCIH